MGMMGLNLKQDVDDGTQLEIVVNGKICEETFTMAELAKSQRGCQNVAMAFAFFAVSPKLRYMNGNHEWQALSELQRFGRVFTCFKSVTAGGADGRLAGINGSINAASTQRVLRLLRANAICDVGAADGKFMMCAAIGGVQRVVGVEMVENIAYKMVLDAAVHRMKLRYDIHIALEWYGSNVEEVCRFVYCLPWYAFPAVKDAFP